MELRQFGVITLKAKSLGTTVINIEGVDMGTFLYDIFAVLVFVGGIFAWRKWGRKSKS